MRRTLLLFGITLAIASPSAAQARHDADSRAAIRDQVRDALRDGPVKGRELARAYQGRNQGSEQTERFSRKVRLGRDGRISVSNISGDITVTTGGGDEASIDAVKRTRGNQSEL